MHRPLLVLTATLLMAAATHAQFEIQDSTTTADLRGVSAPGNGVAWASGTHGTVVRTEDGGYMWQGCAMPPGAEQLDFRGIQAFDDRTALVMSSGKGALSRIYKTTDGCQSWKLVFTNPDADGFFDAMYAQSGSRLFLLGDPVNGLFSLRESDDGGVHWQSATAPGLAADASKQGAFAASNSSLYANGLARAMFGSGGKGGSFVYRLASVSLCVDGKKDQQSATSWSKTSVPLGSASESSGVFSLGTAPQAGTVVAVGGDYRKPDAFTGTAAHSEDDGQHWTAAAIPPHGYRSSVAYDASTKTWITVGPNGADISTDDGRHWRPLRPMPGDAPGTDTGWNALALPWVVGPRGRIGKFHADALRLDTARADGR